MDDYTVQTLDDFEGEGTTVGVGFKFHGVFDDGNVEVGPGDLAYWEDLDAGMHTGECPAISEREFVVVVQHLYAVDYDWVEGYAVEIGARAPLGRLSLGDCKLAQQENPPHIENHFDEFAESDYTKWMKWEGHFDLEDVPDQYVDGHENAQPSCWYDGDGDATNRDGE